MLLAFSKVIGMAEVMQVNRHDLSDNVKRLEFESSVLFYIYVFNVQANWMISQTSLDAELSKSTLSCVSVEEDVLDLLDGHHSFFLGVKSLDND